MNDPHVTPIASGLNFKWPGSNVRVIAERYTNDGSAELTLYFSGNKVQGPRKVNLLSQPTLNSLAKSLKEVDGETAWPEILSAVANKTLEVARKGEPAVPIGQKPDSTKIEYQLAPILEKNQPATIYGPGGSAKSYLADYIACLVQFNVMGLQSKHSCWFPAQGNVLYLDWEASQGDHQRRVWAIKKGLGIDTEDTFLYRFCHQPLEADIYNIQSLVAEKEISLLIIDSQMAASGYGPDPAQSGERYYNALRSLRCTTLTLDHISKSEWGKSTEADSTGPFGSVVKFNRSRSQFEVKKSQTAGDDYLELSLVHRKHNEGKMLKPIGIRIEFENKGDELERVIFSPCDIRENSELSKTMSARDRIVELLKREGKLEVKVISEKLDIPENTVRARLSDNKKMFEHFKDGWGLLTNEILL